MQIIGVTGGIASGKTTITRLFEEKYAIPVLDADVFVHRVLTPSHPIFTQICRYFGKRICTTSGQINKKVLRRLLFQHPRKRAWLASHLHPLVFTQFHDALQKLTQSPSPPPYCLAVVPLLMETWRQYDYSFIHQLLLVDVPASLQLRRIMQRDQLSLTQARHHLAAQYSRVYRRHLLHTHPAYKRLPHHIISGNAEKTVYGQQVDRLHQQWSGDGSALTQYGLVDIGHLTRVAALK